MIRLIRSALLLPLFLGLAACGSDDPATEGTSVPAGTDVGMQESSPVSTGSDVEADERAVANYRLNEQDLQRWSAVMNSPEQQAALEDDTDSDGDVSSLREMVENNPSYLAAVEREGLTPTRFAIISHVVIASMAVLNAERAGMDADSLSASFGIDPANVRFIAEHETAVSQLPGM